MDSMKDINDSDMQRLQSLFLEIISYLYEHVGSHVFRTAKEKITGIVWAKKINPVVFDAVCSAAYMYGVDNLPDISIAEQYTRLVLDKEFVSVTRQRTTDTANILKRAEIASRILFC